MKNKIFTFTFLVLVSCSAFAIDTVYKENISNQPFWNECTYSGDVVRDIYGYLPTVKPNEALTAIAVINNKLNTAVAQQELELR